MFSSSKWKGKYGNTPNSTADYSAPNKESLLCPLSFLGLHSFLSTPSSLGILLFFLPCSSWNCPFSFQLLESHSFSSGSRPYSQPYCYKTVVINTGTNSHLIKWNIMSWGTNQGDSLREKRCPAYVTNYKNYFQQSLYWVPPPPNIPNQNCRLEISHIFSFLGHNIPRHKKLHSTFNTTDTFKNLPLVSFIEKQNSSSWLSRNPDELHLSIMNSGAQHIL